MPGVWSQVEIAGKTADVYEPAAPAAHNRVVLHLHGHGLGPSTLRDDAIYSAEFDRYGLRCVSPHGARSWWLYRICSEFDSQLTPLKFLRGHVVPWIEQRWGTKPPGIGLTGISMGGQGVLQLAYRHPREFPVVAAISPAVDFHQLYGQGFPLDEMFALREAARQETVLLQIHPLNWPKNQLIVCDPADEEWFEGADRLVMKLSSMGIPVERDLTTTHGGHTWDYFHAMAAPVLKFVADRLDLESRRV